MMPAQEKKKSQRNGTTRKHRQANTLVMILPGWNGIDRGQHYSAEPTNDALPGNANNPRHSKIRPASQ
jgi:hypothetical protein